MANSEHYEFHVKGDEGTGTPVDSAEAKIVSVGSAISDLWVNEGWMTTVASNGTGSIATSGAITIPQPDWDLSNGDSLVLGFWMQLGTGLTQANRIAGTRYFDGEYGFNIFYQTNGLMWVQFESTTGTSEKVNFYSESVVYDDKPHHIVIAVDGTTKRAYLMVDGKSESSAKLTTDLYPVDGNTVNQDGNPIGFGMAGDGSGQYRSYIGRWRDIHCLVVKAGGLPDYMYDITGAMIYNPFTTLDSEKFDNFTRTKNILVAVIGQSNEADTFAGNGRPIVEVSIPSAGSTEYQLGYRHNYLDGELVTIDQDGLTSSVDVPIESITATSITVLDANLSDTYTAVGGFVKVSEVMNQSVIGCPNKGSGQWTFLAEQEWRSRKNWVTTVDMYAQPASSFIEDWCGVTNKGDAATVLAEGDGGFDPNGYLASAKAEFENWAAAGFDEIHFIYQHGQADIVTTGIIGSGGSFNSSGATTTAIQRGYYEEALTNMLDYFSSVLPTKIYMGSSNGSGTSTLWNEVIVEGMRNVIAQEGLIEGAMLSETLSLRANTNEGDPVHLNEDGQRQAGEIWGDVYGAYSGGGVIFSGNTITLSGIDPNNKILDLNGNLVTKTYTRGYLISDADDSVRANFSSVEIVAGDVVSTTGESQGDISGKDAALTLLDESGSIAAVAYNAVLS